MTRLSSYSKLIAVIDSAETLMSLWDVGSEATIVSCLNMFGYEWLISTLAFAVMMFSSTCTANAMKLRAALRGWGSPWRGLSPSSSPHDWGNGTPNYTVSRLPAFTTTVQKALINCSTPVPNLWQREIAPILCWFRQCAGWQDRCRAYNAWVWRELLTAE